MKKILITFAFLLYSICLFCQYVTLEGRQFKDRNLHFNESNSENFFPIVCPYQFDWITIDNATNFYISPYASFDNTVLLPNPNCQYESLNEDESLLQIQRHFKQIHDMHFNTIRLWSAGPYYQWKKFKLSIEKVCPWEQILIDLGEINLANPNLLKVFVVYNKILEKAYDEKIHVILDPIEGYWMKKDEHDLTGWDSFKQDYLTFLNCLGFYMKNYASQKAKEALIAYCILEEPGGWDLIPAKSQICEAVKLWYDEIKSFDPDHLITIGGFGGVDLDRWDPTIMKMDFYSIHLYPKRKEYEDDIISLEAVYNRFACETFWAQNILPMPYITGETGFRAVAGWDYPQVDGDLNEQKDYAQYTMNKTFSSSGSGYSWWNYQDYSWGDENSSDRYYGLLSTGFCNAECTDLEKPVVEVFKSYGTPAMSYGSMPSNFFDPCNNFVYSASSKLYTGIVTYGPDYKPLENCYIRGATHLRIDPDNLDQFIDNVFYTYSDMDGKFEFVPFDYDNREIYYDNISYIWASTPLEESGWYIPTEPGNTNIHFNKKNTFQFSNTFSDIIINSPNYNLEAWDNLTAEAEVKYNQGSGGDIKARRTVTLKSGSDPNKEVTFQSGSEVHIFNSETFPNCIQCLKEEKSLTDEEQMILPTAIKLNFTKNIFDFLLYPNPTSSVCKVNIIDNDDKFDYRISIFTVSGILVHQINETRDNFYLNFSNFNKGCYFIEISKSNNFLIKVKKIIVI